MSSQNQTPEKLCHEPILLGLYEIGMTPQERRTRIDEICEDDILTRGKILLALENPELAARNVALKIIENFDDFKEGRASYFTAYFSAMIPEHRSHHNHFINLLGLEPYNPVEDRTPSEAKIVLETEQFKLIRRPVINNEGTPEHVIYTAQRLVTGAIIACLIYCNC